MTRDGKKLHFFGHLLRNKIAEIIAKIAQKIARKIEKFNGVLDNQKFYSTLRKKPGIVDKLVVHFLQTFLVKKCQQTSVCLNYKLNL